MCAAQKMSEIERKREIMDAASKIIIAKGLEKTTMEEIIAGTSLSKGGVYHYYNNVLEIFKDIMICGIEYRNRVIKEHIAATSKKMSNAFMAQELVSKMIDDNPYMPLYVEFLIAKKRKPELNTLMLELQEQTKKRFKTFTDEVPHWIADANLFQFVTDFINAMILASDVLDARDCFAQNRQLLEEMLVYVFSQGEGEY